jgi:hypothetical protein
MVHSEVLVIHVAVAAKLGAGIHKALAAATDAADLGLSVNDEMQKMPTLVAGDNDPFAVRAVDRNPHKVPDHTLTLVACQAYCRLLIPAERTAVEHLQDAQEQNQVPLPHHYS